MGRHSAKVLKHACAVALGLVALSGKAADDFQWHVAPIYGGGYFQNVIICPSATNVWYCYVDVGGPYRSDDAGATWRPLHSNFSPCDRHFQADHVRTMSVDPRNADSFVLCSGNNSDAPAGIYVSRDGGRSFRKTLRARFYGNGRDRALGLVLVRNPSNPDELVAASDRDGIFRSRDNGETWQVVGGKGAYFTDVKFDRTVVGRLYACSPHDLSGKGEPAFWRSDDSGETWSVVAKEPLLEFSQIRGRNELVGTCGREVKVSRDGGRSWQPFDEGLGAWQEDVVSYNNPGYYYALGAGPDFYVIGSAYGRIYRRKTDGAAWTEVPRGKMTFSKESEFLSYAVADGRMDSLCSLVVDENDPKHWIATDFYDIWESFDGGSAWRTRMDGIMPLVSFTVGFDPLDANRICYGVADMMMFCSTDGGRSFFPPANRPGSFDFAYSRSTPHLMYSAGGQWGVTRFGRSTDGGLNWTYPVKPGCGLPDQKFGANPAFSVAVDPLTDDVYLAVAGPCEPGKGGVYRSQDGGVSWASCSKGLPAGRELFTAAPWGGSAHQMTFGPDGSFFCVPWKVGGLYRFNREAQAWDKVSDVGSLPVPDPFTPGRLIRCGNRAGVSTDGGRTFRDAPELKRFWRIAFDGQAKNLAVGASGDGFYVSYDGARTFEKLPDSLRVPSGARRDVYVGGGTDLPVDDRQRTVDGRSAAAEMTSRPDELCRGDGRGDDAGSFGGGCGGFCA